MGNTLSATAEPPQRPDASRITFWKGMPLGAYVEGVISLNLEGKTGPMHPSDYLTTDELRRLGDALRERNARILAEKRIG